MQNSFFSKTQITNVLKKPDKKWPMDIYLYYGNGPQDRFQARNFGGQTDGQWQLELKGISAIGKPSKDIGILGSGPFTIIWIGIGVFIYDAVKKRNYLE